MSDLLPVVFPDRPGPLYHGTALEARFNFLLNAEPQPAPIYLAWPEERMFYRTFERATGLIYFDHRTPFDTKEIMHAAISEEWLARSANYETPAVPAILRQSIDRLAAIWPYNLSVSAKALAARPSTATQAMRFLELCGFIDRYNIFHADFDEARTVAVWFAGDALRLPECDTIRVTWVAGLMGNVVALADVSFRRKGDIFTPVFRFLRYTLQHDRPMGVVVPNGELASYRLHAPEICAMFGGRQRPLNFTPLRATRSALPGGGLNA